MQKAFLATLIAAAFTWTACTEDEPENPNPSESNLKNITVNVSTVVGDEPFELSTAYDFNGQQVIFSEMKFFITNVSLGDENGNSTLQNVPGNGAYLITPSGGTFEIGQVPEGIVQTVNFAIGMDSVLNNPVDLTNLSAPLDDGTMQWPWNPMKGYKFVKMEGTVDGENFLYHVATNGMYTEVPQIQYAGTVIGDTEVDMTVDIREFFSGISVVATEGGVPVENRGADPDCVDVMDNVAAGLPFSF